MAPRTTSRGALAPPRARARTLLRGGCEGAARRPIAECPQLPRGRARGARLPRASPRFDASSDRGEDRKSTRLNSSHSQISYAVFCLKKKKTKNKILCRCRQIK